jgi:hypothetical protein
MRKMTRRDESCNKSERQIYFGSTVSETFTVNKRLSSELIEKAMCFWRERGLSIKNAISPSELTTKERPTLTSFLAEGGSIWTTSFEQYKKTINVCFTGTQEQTQVFVHMVLPGGLMSSQDREKAADLILSFHEALIEES